MKKSRKTDIYRLNLSHFFSLPADLQLMHIEGILEYAFLIISCFFIFN